jgi:hypothetical protein
MAKQLPARPCLGRRQSNSGSRKVANLRRNPSASVVVDAREPGRERWAAAIGTVEILSGEESGEINARIRQRYLTAAALADERIEPVFALSDDVTLRLTPTAWRSWSARDLDAMYFGGILAAEAERWFQPLVS